jgi:uncharacterized damage-inducible protein DinB
MRLYRHFAVPVCCAALMLSVAAFGQSGTAPQAASATGPIAPGDTLNAMFAQFEQEVVGAAEAMPADKYDFAPTCTGDFKGVRTFGEQVKHIAQANYHFFRGWGVPGEIDPKTLDSLKTKDELIKALRDSFAYAQAAINSITPENAFSPLPGLPPGIKATRVSIAALAMAHPMDHYGQMVEYLRMNGIIPPASRK